MNAVLFGWGLTRWARLGSTMNCGQMWAKSCRFSFSLLFIILYSATTLAVVATRSLCGTPQPLSGLENGERNRSRETAIFSICESELFHSRNGCDEEETRVEVTNQHEVSGIVDEAPLYRESHKVLLHPRMP